MDRYKGELLSDDTRRFLAQPKRMAIGGEWVEALGGGMLEVVDPASGQVFDRVPAGEATDIDRAVAAARRAFEQGDWPRMRPVDRERLLLRLAELVEAHAQELAEIEALDNGKPVTMARAVDVALVVDFLRYMAGWATKIEGSTMEVSVPLVRDREFFGYTRREPVGVVGAIIPWNFPLLMVAWKAGPALASGCTMVLKPAEETPLSALRFAELVQQAGYPAGVFNVVTGHGHSAGAALAAHKGVDKVAFTGSTEIGKLVGKAALDNMTRVSLELGGKSPVIVLDDADPAVAAAGAAQAIFFNQGQVCCAGSRLYVHKSRFERVVEGLSGIAADMKLGAGIEPSTQIGPLVSAVQQQRVLGYIRSGFEEGARAGGRRSGRGRGLLRQADGAGRYPRRHARGARGDLRPGGGGDALRRSRRGRPPRQRHPIRPRRQHLVQRPVAGAPPGAEDQGRYGVGQLPQHPRRLDALRRLQAVRHRPRDGARGARPVHRGQVGDHGPVRGERRAAAALHALSIPCRGTRGRGEKA